MGVIFSFLSATAVGVLLWRTNDNKGQSARLAISLASALVVAAAMVLIVLWPWEQKLLGVLLALLLCSGALFSSLGKSRLGKHLPLQIAITLGFLAATSTAGIMLMYHTDLAPTNQVKSDASADQADERYRKIIDKYPGHFVTDESTLFLALNSLVHIGNVESQKAGSDILIAYLADRPDNTVAATMHSLLAGYFERSGQYHKMIEHLIAADKAGLPGIEPKSRTYWQIADVAEKKLKDYKLAASWYQRIVDDIGDTSGDYYVAKIAVQRCKTLAEGGGGGQ